MSLPLLFGLAALAASPNLRGVPQESGDLSEGAQAQSTQPKDSEGVTRAFVGARILPISGAPIEQGVLVVAEGKILSVSAGSTAPRGAEVIDVRGKTIMPGLICTHSHLGGVGGADGSGPIQPDVRVSDSLNVRDSGYMRGLAGGLTALNVMPGYGHLLSGQTIYLKLRRGARRIEEMFICDGDGAPMGGLKMANGTNPMKGGAFPGTRGRSAALVRKQFIAAQEYMAKVEAAGEDVEKLPNRHIGLEALAEVLSGKRVVHHHTHRHDDILTVLRLAEEFDFRVVLHHVSEAWKVADEIAESGAACSIILVDSPGGKLEAIDVAFKTGGVLERAGVKVAFHTDDWITDSRLFLRMGALASFALGLSSLSILMTGAAAQVAVRGEVIHTGTGERIENGLVIIQDGKISAIGPALDIDIPDGFEVLTAAVVTPGLVDVRSVGDAENRSFQTAAKLHGAGIPFAIQSGYEAYVPKTRVVLFEAALAASHGLGFDAALASITSGAARILGLGDRIGSLAVGMDGDLALFDGDPFEYTTHCVGTVLEGEVVARGERQR